MKSIDSPNFKLTENVEIPSNINLDAYPLFKQRVFGEPTTINNGRLLEVIHYKTFDGVSYSDVVVKEVYTYVNITGFLAQKTIDIIFYKEDDSIGDTQSKVKYYNGDNGMLESIEEGESRRKYLIKKGKAYLLSQIGIEAGIVLFSSLKTQITEYEGVNNQADLFTAINLSTLTETQKGTLILILTI